MSGRDIWRENEQTYWDYREAARQALMPTLLESYGASFKISDINAEALRQAEEWTNIHGDVPNPKWDWNSLVTKARRKHRRIELAIWMDTQLCGMVLGKVSDRKVTVSVHYLQRSPDNDLLKGEITDIAILFLDALADIIGCREETMMNPDPNLIDYYKSFGFDSEVKKGKKVIRLVRKF